MVIIVNDDGVQAVNISIHKFVYLCSAFESFMMLNYLYIKTLRHQLHLVFYVLFHWNRAVNHRHHVYMHL